MTEPIWVDSVDGALVAAYDFGGDGDPVLLAHATGFNAHLWMPVVERLRDRFHCYAFDERGHGASPTPPGGEFDWHHFGEDARAVAVALGLRRPRGVGHSAGGALLLLAEEDHPGSWEALWVFEPVVPPWPVPRDDGLTAENPLAGGALRRRDRFATRAEAYEHLASKPPFDAFDPDALHAYVEHGFVDDPSGGIALACRREDEAATYRNAGLHRGYDHLPAVTIPVHVVSGAASTHFPSELMRQVAGRLPHGSAEVMDGLGHFGPFEDPDRVAMSIRRALA